VLFWIESRFPVVFLVRRAILNSVCLKVLVMYVVSLPMYLCQPSPFLCGRVVLRLGWFGAMGYSVWKNSMVTVQVVVDHGLEVNVISLDLI
jgi:hypothetical protein